MKTLGTLVLILLYGAGTAILLPTPSEDPILGFTWIPVGWILLFAAAGRTLGAYFVFALADRAKGTERFRRLVDRRTWLASIKAWSERYVDRYGAILLFGVLCVPGLPDTIPLYVFALAGRRPVLFALVSGLAAAVRMTLVLFGVRLLLGAQGSVP
jgi:uncharacterized membrane protein YdjX (TVP38/TMEM64 family)